MQTTVASILTSSWVSKIRGYSSAQDLNAFSIWVQALESVFGDPEVILYGWKLVRTRSLRIKETNPENSI